MSPEPPRAISQSGRWVMAGAAVTALGVVLDLVSNETVVIGALFLGPFVAALGARPAAVAWLGAASVALAVVLGVPNDIFGNGEHIVRVLIVVAGCAVAVVLAAVRESRERELARAKPAELDALRLALALEAAETGTWRFDI